MSHSETIRQTDIAEAGPLLQWLGDNKFKVGGAIINYGSILMILLAGFIYYILSRTAFGRHIYAIGDDPVAARLSGINVDRTLISVYALAGFICGVAGWVLIGRIGAASPLAGQEAKLRFREIMGESLKEGDAWLHRWAMDYPSPPAIVEIKDEPTHGISHRYIIDRSEILESHREVWGVGEWGASWGGGQT